MYPNTKASEVVALLTTIDPVSQGVGSVTSSWISVAQFHNFMAVIHTGVLGASATVDAKVQQAIDSSGTSAKDITGKAITQIVKASGDNKQAIINVRGSELDVTNSFYYVRISITVGTAASLVAAHLYGFNPRYADASASNQAAVAQVI